MSQPATFRRFLWKALVRPVQIQSITLFVAGCYFALTSLSPASNPNIPESDPGFPAWLFALAGVFTLAAIVVTFYQYRIGELPEPGSLWNWRRRRQERN